MKEQEMFSMACAACGMDPRTPFDAWSFGDAPDRLAQLVLHGIKTATSSAYELYALEGEPLPTEGAYSVLLDGKGDAACVLRTTRVSICPFDEVSAEHAYKEGEDDRTLDAWRRVHERFFTAELSSVGLSFSGRMPVVCEEFEVFFCPQR